MHKFEIKGLLSSSDQEMEMHIQGIWKAQSAKQMLDIILKCAINMYDILTHAHTVGQLSCVCVYVCVCLHLIWGWEIRLYTY